MKNTFFVIAAAAAIASCTPRQGNICAITETSRQPDGTFVHNAEFSISGGGNPLVDLPVDNKKEFDKKGNLARETFFNPDGSVRNTYVYEYADGKESKCTRYSPMDAVEEITVTTYGDGGRVAQKATYSALGRLLYVDEYKHEGRQTTLTQISAQGEILYQTVSAYDQNGNKTREVMPLGDSTEMVTTFAYDSQNRLVRQCEDNAGSVTTWTFAYDNFGNQTEKTTHFEDGSQLTENYTYKYDSRNNWTEKTCIFDENPLFLTKRTIEYK